MEKRDNAVTMKGNPVTLLGAELKVGAKAPEFALTNGDLAPVSLADSAGKRRLLIVVPSLDTPTCATETKEFNNRLAELSGDMAIYVISRDLPFAQKRFCGSEGVSNISSLSGYKDNGFGGSGFGESYGVLIEGLELYARAIFIVEADDTISYVQLVKEIAEEPDYDEVIKALA